MSTESKMRTEESVASAAPEAPKPHHPRNRKPRREKSADHKEDNSTAKNHDETNIKSDTVSPIHVNNSDIVGDTVLKSSKPKKPRSKKKPKQDKVATENHEDLKKPLDTDAADHVDGISQYASGTPRDHQQSQNTPTRKVKNKHHKREHKKTPTSAPEADGMDSEKHQSVVPPKDGADIVDLDQGTFKALDGKTHTANPRIHGHSDEAGVNVVGETKAAGGSGEDGKKGLRTTKPSNRTKKKSSTHAANETVEIEEIDYNDLDKMPTLSKHHTVFKKAMHREFVPKAKQHELNQTSKAKQNSDSKDWRATAAPPKATTPTAPPKDRSNGKHHTSLHPDDYNPRNRREMFPKFMPHKDVLPLLESQKLYKGSLRINRRNRQDAYVTSDDLEYDIYIHGATNRNRALEGDIVAVQLKDVEEVWAVKKAKDEKDADKKKDQPNPFAPKDEREIEVIPNDNESCTNDEDEEDKRKPKYCGIIVAILDRSQEPMLTGTISLNRPGQGDSTPKKKRNNNEEERPRPKPSMFWIKPTDKRMPFVALGIRYAPKGFLEDESKFSNKLFVARITQWPITEKHPFGELVQELGNVGDLAAEAKALLAENCINDQDFPKAALACLPATPWQIPAAEFDKRRDLRSYRIFSIDPETAKDLDDAVHVIDKGNGQYEVGVHIADVSFFIKSRSALDTEARSRGTSTYLVDRVIPMLPSLLCEQLCSLNPGVERLAFSVIWQMDEFGNINDTWFGRSIIRSCGKLAYQHAQDVIEGRPLSSKLQIHEHTAEDVEKDILNLFKISKHLRKARFDNGALSMNSVKLYFDLDDEGKPIDCHLYEQKDANRLIEEFMLCANISVAEKIASKYPDEALLRRHAPPIERRLEEFLLQAENLGYVLDGSSAGALQASFNEIESPEVKETLLILAIKPMQRAKYFCTGLLDISKYVHYALNVPMYTHFTSPIRRYADVIVHRQLEAALNDVEKFPLDSKEIARIAQQCNIKKDGAKNAQDASIQLYLAEYIHRHTQLHGPMYCDATVVAVLDSAYEIFIPEYGIEKRLHLDRMALTKSTYDLPNHTLILTWQADATEMNNTEPEKPVLNFDDDDSLDEEDLVKAVESKLLMQESNKTVETASETTTESDNALARDTPGDSPASNNKKQSDSTATSTPSSDGIQIIKVFEKVKVRLEVDMNKTPPMINVHSVNPHFLV